MAASKGPAILGGETEIDWVADPQRLVDHIPRLQAFFEKNEQIRRVHEEIARVTSHGRNPGTSYGGSIKHVARVPHSVLGGILWKEPYWGIDKKATYKWLERNPAYRVDRTLR